MALPINVEDLIHQRKVERMRIEYKADWNPEPIIHSITAFANDFDNMGGGYILIGVEEVNGRPKLPLEGLDPDSIDAIQMDLLNKCNFIEPRCIPVIEPYINQNYTFLRSLLMGQARFHPEDTATATDLAQKLSDLKTPPVSADTAAIRTIFMQIVADIKASAASESKMYQAATSEILEDFRNTLTKGEE